MANSLRFKYAFIYEVSIYGIIVAIEIFAVIIVNKLESSSELKNSMIIAIITTGTIAS